MRDFERRLDKIERRMPKKNHRQFSDVERAARLEYLLAPKGAQKEMTLEELIERIGTNGGPLSDDRERAARLKQILTAAMRRSKEREVGQCTSSWTA